MKKSTWVSLGLIALIIVIAVLPFMIHSTNSAGEEAFGGTDDGAEEIITQYSPDYQPWFQSIIGELPGEVESGLFALQAALGAGVVGYTLGVYRGRAKERAGSASKVHKDT
ncbi:energy-coupling factor ABC transporter substrate-binding protein [Corynebacterium sp. sy017]|uniref:energy-coupling factor ABC transporter substrate-binding protein n=1 Tax=unclassified Corynebacterium TaxID=2624378 RepID=UPI001185D26F|nr:MULTISPECIES: energy-coupling factor ABC transporter substrate-binding protein [unclassified Corynebacterium]MBP3088236.1 energy-coupling factor ABC transporter substrate-binding protein [Corynebacterium sp. sy017]QDZ43422.1 energy-coupling factor ABC transporter substrate-binding protein [Corynebacterium sp. sy039]TSD91566.1 energy-coupling factor ABC transporter substrate-binding protein [Corynebacterium sp. SY003]